MNKILVATDGSEGANRAVDYASRRAKMEGAELLIVNIAGHGLPDQVFRSMTRSQHSWLDELLASLSAETLTKARERARGIGVEIVQLESRRGEVAQAVIEVAREKEVEAIVVGKHGAGRVAELLLGSVAHKLVSLAPLPVTVVP
jgi:nucleotide-binding universal stress UspA family protein